MTGDSTVDLDYWKRESDLFAMTHAELMAEVRRLERLLVAVGVTERPDIEASAGLAAPKPNAEQGAPL